MPGCEDEPDLVHETVVLELRQPQSLACCFGGPLQPRQLPVQSEPLFPLPADQRPTEARICSILLASASGSKGFLM